MLESTITIIGILLIFTLLNIVKSLFKESRSKKTKRLLKKYINSNRIKINTFHTSILFPIIISSIYWLYLQIFLNFSGCSSLTLEKLTSIIITPIFEEFVFRGFLLTSFIIIFGFVYEQLNIDKDHIMNSFVINSISIILSAAIFSFGHNGAFDLRFISGLLIGSVYILDKKNLTPAIISHALNNFILVMITTCVF